MKVSEIPNSLFQSLKLHFKTVSALKNSKKESIPVIVSLTTIPSRLRTLHITIRSLLSQDVQPDKIILWLNESYKNNIPNQLKKLLGDTFEIRFSPFTFSHRKLIHSIECFPGKTIITCDDDIIYPPKSLSLLYNEHLKNPDVVIGNRCRRITYTKENNLIPYLKWPFIDSTSKGEKLLMPVGAFLILYPPNALDSRYNNIELINELSPKADDLWFKAMALLNGTLSIQASIRAPFPIPIIATQKYSLKKINTREDFNRIQWEQITKYFDLKF